MKRSQALTIFLTALISGSVVFFVDYLRARRSSLESRGIKSLVDDAAIDVAVAETLVTLSPEQLASLSLKTEQAAVQAMTRTVTLAGRLDFDQNRHVAIQAACDGILTKIRVRPGDAVAAGDIVATLSSPDVGMARTELRKRESDVRLAQSVYDRQSSITSGVEKLVQMIRDKVSPETVMRDTEDLSLGEYRSSLLGAYTSSRLATMVADSSRSASNSGAISGRVQLERDAAAQSAIADINSLAEKSLFDVQRVLRESEASLANAQRLRDVSQQQLRTLLGPAAPAVASDTSEHVESAALSQVNLVAAIDGTIEEQLLTENERVVAGESVFTIADTSQLWAIGDVREGDWSEIAVKVGDRVSLKSPAIPNAEFTGKVITLPRIIDPATGAAKLVAQVNESDSRLRPGLFIRMTVPASISRECLSVPETAVVVHEDQKFVFVQESESTFRRFDVEVGDMAGDRIEITSGLEPGTFVVTAGVFQLKSSLLLSGEEE